MYTYLHIVKFSQMGQLVKFGKKNFANAMLLHQLLWQCKILLRFFLWCCPFYEIHDKFSS